MQVFVTSLRYILLCQIVQQICGFQIFHPDGKNSNYSQYKCINQIKAVEVVKFSTEVPDIVASSSKFILYPSCLEICCMRSNCFRVYYSGTHCIINTSMHEAVQKKYEVQKHKRGIEANKNISNSYQLLRTTAAPTSTTTTIRNNQTYGFPCEIGLNVCGHNEICNPINRRRRTGTCVCMKNAVYDNNEGCIISNSVTSTSKPNFVPVALPLEEVVVPTELVNLSLSNTNDSANRSNLTTLQTPVKSSTSTTPLPLEKVDLEIKNKTLVLERGSNIYQDWFTLSASIKDDKANTSKYVYKWTIIEKPSNDDSGSMKNGNLQTVSLTNLVAGVYKLQLEVTGPNAYGQAIGNITVHPANHRNKAPIAIIVPTNLTVNLPNNGVILDGSGSKDEGPIKSFHWELTMGPMSYKLTDETSKTLQLNNLIAGNYTIMLIVEDEQGLTGNTTASVYVVKETDYPPIANAGGDKIIYLPVNTVILNGNMSSDDHGIKEWEWTKGPEDSGNAIDMQDTRTPFLRLSNLESGHYHFILKVSDASGQSSNSSAHVYVHDSADNVPKANAGNNVTLTIPNTSTTLDGSKSTGVTSQSHYLWTQISGVTKAILSSPHEPMTNVSGLTRGVYKFCLTMWNGNDTLKNSTNNVTVNVIQDKNATPIARAGNDFEVVLPSSAIVVNGSKSSDDIGIVKWLWKRDSRSLAAGNIIKGSDRSPILIFTGAVPGLYVWNLTVWDDQGSSDSDTVSIVVKNGRFHRDEVEVLLGIGIESFTIGQRDSFLQTLQLLTHSSSDINFLIQDVRGIPLSGQVSLVVIGQRNKTTIPGYLLSNELRSSVMSPVDVKILDLSIISIDTVVCQNNCSEHGECIQLTRQCRCHSWWMESWIRRNFGDGLPNCDWSVIYVFVVTLVIAFLIGLALWGSVVLIIKKFRVIKPKRQRHTRYSLLDNQEEPVKLRARPPRNLLDSSSSDSDSDALFDARKNRPRDKRTNGHIKLHRVRNS